MAPKRCSGDVINVDLSDSNDEPSPKKARVGMSDAYGEVFSPPRIVPYVSRHGLPASLSVDITWAGGERDLLTAYDRAYTLSQIQLRDIMMLGLSPPCTQHSILQNLNSGKVPAHVLAERKKKYAFQTSK